MTDMMSSTSGLHQREQAWRAEVLEYAQKVFANRRDRHVQFQALLPKNDGRPMRILDIGSGMGHISHLLAQRFPQAEVVGMDQDAQQLGKARAAYGEHPRLRFCSAEDFVWEDEAYDLVFSSMVIEHVHNPGSFLSQIHRSLKKDGQILIGLPNIVNPRYLLDNVFFSAAAAREWSKKILNDYDKVHCHINGWCPRHFTNLLSSCGFLVEDWLPTEGIPTPWIVRRIPLLKWLVPSYYRGRLSQAGPWKRSCYSMFFLAKKATPPQINGAQTGITQLS